MFSNDGTRFLSCGFDKQTILWDTETGQALGSYSNKFVPYCAKFYPADNNSFITGNAGCKLIQWDIREGNIAQEYDPPPPLCPLKHTHTHTPPIIHRTAFALRARRVCLLAIAFACLGCCAS